MSMAKSIKNIFLKEICVLFSLQQRTTIVTRKLAMLKKLTCIVYCALKIHEIYVICLYFSREKIKCC